MWTAIIALLLLLLSQGLSLIATLVIMLMRAGRELSSLSPSALLQNEPDASLFGTCNLFFTLLLIWLLCSTRLTAPRPLRAFAQGMPARWVWSIVAFMLLSFGLSLTLHPFAIEDEVVTRTFLSMKDNVWCVLLIVLAGPVSEELIFRACIVRVLRPSGGFIAILCSALAFAVVHGNLMQGIPAFFMGIALALLYLHTGDVRLCLPAHVCNNLVGYLQMRFCPDSEWLDASPAWLPVSAGMALIVAGSALLCVFLLRGNSEPSSQSPLQNA